MFRGDIGTSKDTPVCAVPCKIFGKEEELVAVRLSDGLPVRVNSREAQLLVRMSTSRPLSEWIESLCKEDIENGRTRGGSGLSQRLSRSLFSLVATAARHSPTDIYGPLSRSYNGVVSSLIAKRLLVPSDSAVQAILIRSAARAALNCRITSLCIPAHSRPNNLYRCVSSFSQNLARGGRTDASILVVDDSSDKCLELNNRSALNAFPSDGKVPVRFWGYQERQRLMAN